MELSLAALGIRKAKFSSISDAFLRKLLLGAMPWCFDDPDDAEQLQKVLLTVFGGNTIGNIQSHGASRIVPVVTANQHILDELATRDERYSYMACRIYTVFHMCAFLYVTFTNPTFALHMDYGHFNTHPHFSRILCRAKLIPFLHKVKYNLLQTTKINAAFDSAPAALPHLIHVGYSLSRLNPTDLTNIMNMIQEALPTLDSRIVMEYTLTVASALMVCATIGLTSRFHYRVATTLLWLAPLFYFQISLWLFERVMTLTASWMLILNC